MHLQYIEKALKSTGRLHAFRSGAGLRVVRVEKKGKLIGYGEHPTIEIALAHANRDLRKGPSKPYSKMYGKKYPHYITGSLEISSLLDNVILRGDTFDIWYDGHQFTVEIKGLRQTRTPDEVHDRVSQTGKPERWTDHGFLFETSREPRGTTTRVVEVPKGSTGGDAWFYSATKTGKASDLWVAIDHAVVAPPAREGEPLAA